MNHDRIHFGNRAAGDGEPTLLLAEIGSNHNGDLALARRLIDAAADSGWDGVKFQLFRAEWLYPTNAGVADTPAGAMDIYELLKQIELQPGWLPELKQHAESRGLLFLCTPFDEEAVALLDRAGVSAFKIASPELNHVPLLRAAAATRKPLVCSTGLCTLQDAEEALATIRAVNPAAEVMLLQCVTAYPTPVEESNLGVIETLARAFGVPTGLSDHTTDFEAVPATAAALGARLIEKHVTADRKLPGPDHPFAIEPHEMKRMAEAVRAIERVDPADRFREAGRRYGAERVAAIRGHGRKEIMPSEVELYPCDKRSIHAVRDIAPGEVLTVENLRVVRSERNLQPGLHPRHLDDVLGARLTRPLAIGEGLLWNHLLSR